MKLIDRYIGMTVLRTSLVVLFAFLGLMSLFGVIDELGDVKGGYGVLDALWYVALTLPRMFYEVLPFVVFLGVLIGLGSLAGHSELVVMRAAGISAVGFFRAVAWPAIVLLVCGMLIGERVSPRSEELAEAHRARSLQNSDVILLSRGYWYREGPLYMNVAGIGAGGELIGVRQYWYDDDNRLERTRVAASAGYVPGADAHWLLVDVQETHLAPDGPRQARYPALRWDGRVEPRLLSARVLIEPRKLSLKDLSYQIDYMRREGLDPGRYELAYWSKIMLPFGVLSLALLALVFVLGPLRQVSLGLRLSVGILVGLGFKYLQDLFAPMTLVYEVHAAVGVALPIIACVALAAVLLRRIT